MADRWFLVPVAGAGTYADKYRPKYSGQVEGWSGRRVTINGSEYYVARFYATVSTLDSIESNTDATSIAEAGLSKSDVASHLNQATGYSYSFAEWEERFLSIDASG